MPNNKDYIVIQGWMINDLKLNGNELLAFALIYGFCKDGQSKFTGSLNYLCEWLNCSRNTAIKSLNDLSKKNLIKKEQVEQNKVIFNKYSVSEWVVQKLHGGSSESALGGSAETAPNNTNINNTINNIEERKLKFASTLNKYLDIYPKETIDKFIAYWSESNKSNTKFKYELERTWDLERRLNTWVSNENKFNFAKPKDNNNTPNTYREL
jgi:hypothetical protein